MKRSAVIGLTTVGVLAAGGVAWAALGGFLVVPDAVQGVIQGGGSGSCQTGGLTFTVPDPTWDNTLGDYAISSVDYSGVTAQCVNLGTADLDVNLVVNGTTSIATATATNIGSSTGTLALNPAVSFDDAISGTWNYLVNDN